MSSIFVASVESNVKGGVACALGPKTLIVGPNGSGKSGVLNSVELALTGRVSDLVGRAEVAKEVELLALAPGRTGELYARARLSDGSEATWRAGAKGAKKAQHLYPPNVVDKDRALPLRPVREAILGSPETARKFFLQYAVGKVSDKDVLDRIPEGLHAYYRRAVLSAGIADAPLDKLLLALEKAKKETRAAKDRAKASTAASNDAAQGLAALPTEEMVKALKEQQKTAKKMLEGLVASEAAAGALDKARAQLVQQELSMSEGADKVRTLRANLALAEAEVAKTPSPVTLDDAFKHITAAIEWHIANGGGGGACLVCGNAATHAHFDTRRAAAHAFAQRAKAEADAFNMVAARRDAVKMDLAVAEADLATLTTQTEALKTAVTQAEGGGGPDPAVIAQARADVDRIDAELNKVDVLKASWSAAEKARSNAKEAEKEAGEWKGLADACVTAVGALLDAGVAGFAHKVQENLPATDQFTLALRDGDRQVFQFGFVRSGVLHTALSGAEWARVTAALAGVCSPPSPLLSVVIPEERAFDPNTLYAALMAFNHLDAQVIIASPIMPSAVPEGWTVIDTSKEQNRALLDPAAATAAPAPLLGGETPAQAPDAPVPTPTPPAPGNGVFPASVAVPPAPGPVLTSGEDVPPQPTTPGPTFTF